MTRRRRAEYTQEAPQVNGGNPDVRAKCREFGPVAPPESASYKRGPGEVPEWSIGTVSKTVVRASVPWVRIPPSPPISPPLTILCRNRALKKAHSCSFWRAACGPVEGRLSRFTLSFAVLSLRLLS